MEDTTDTDWIVVSPTDIPPTNEELLVATKQTETCITKLSFLLNLLSEAKECNNMATVRNLLPQCQRIIETLRSKCIPILLRAEQTHASEVLSTKSKAAVSGSLGLTAGVGLWSLIPQVGLSLAAGTAGTVLCALVLYKFAQNANERKKKETDDMNELKQKLSELDSIIPTWASDLTIDNLEEWTLRLSEFMQEEETKRLLANL
jgi:hypothetical protein